MKPILVDRDWDRVAVGLVPVSWDRDYDASKIPPAGDCLHLKKAE
ncbi:hypothetical protein SULAZ_1729 [Sulfurihydrogenibium azorense Az-Fu1]|uniref:Uncharacterized protein n=1 Tax=Sulfurihydrogenibium azorense (strain DSM 15241 / OCM 825 / Az-Fu1) TaxID=204536 RepID=C1DX49_SULAA|nr:hypothetical protein [Sulfurihydrogenibium azorense]ACN99422.1 hypothetical protein SULAZ_1729 [Sulfurihydrogenibium azorense Az-Fu1]